MDDRNEPTTDIDRDRVASERAILLHLSLLLGWILPIPFVNILAPLIIWQVGKDRFPVLDRHGRNAANWVISSTIYGVVLSLTLVGIVLLPVLAGLSLVFPIVAAVRAGQGRVWKYPLTLNILGSKPEYFLRRAAIGLLSLCVFPLVGTVGCAFWARQRSQWLAELSPTQGTVTRVLEQTDAEGDTSYQPEIQFRDATGETYEILPLWRSNPPTYTEGESVPILYPPANPQNAIIDTWAGKWLLVTLAAAIGAIFLVLSALPSLLCLLIARFV